MTFLSEIRYYLNNKYLTSRNLLILLGAAGLICAIVFGYSFYSRNYNQKAFAMFSESIAEYNKAMSTGNSQDFVNAERAFAASYKAYSRATISPFMLAYQADSALKSGNFDSALDLMKKAVDSIEVSSPVYYLYATKLALMQLDSKDESVKNLGKELLEKYAKTFNNPYKDMAAYYLGYQAWVVGDFELAKRNWQILSQAGNDSIWAALAGSKLELVS